MFLPSLLNAEITGVGTLGTSLFSEVQVMSSTTSTAPVFIACELHKACSLFPSYVGLKGWTQLPFTLCAIVPAFVSDLVMSMAAVNRGL